MKKIILPLLSFVFVISLLLTNISAAENSYSWYCKRNKEHKQPTVDSNMSFIDGYDVYYVDKNHSEKNQEKVIYLTFDAGYENGNIEKILDVLKEENVKAAFFILENLLDKNPELVCRMAQEGHLVCNHTSNHPDITKIGGADALRRELSTLEERYSEVTGKEMSKYFRPPEGKFNRTSVELLQSWGYKTILWSFAYADWDNNSQMSEEKAKAKIYENLHNGEIMLLHPTSATNAKIMKDVISYLKDQGYSFGTLDDLK